MLKKVNWLRAILCVLVCGSPCFAQQQSGQHAELNALLAAGEFAQAQQFANAQPDATTRNQFLGVVAQRQADSGNRHGALDSLGSIYQPSGNTSGTGWASSWRDFGSVGGQGGAAMADFTTLIDLIKTTIQPDSWDDLGGAGTIQPFPGGVYIDRDGLMVRLDVRNSMELDVVRREQFDGMFSAYGQDVRNESSMRKVSLVRLQRELERLRIQGKSPDEVMRNMAGIYQVRYVLVYPEQGDLVIAGPAGPWKEDLDGRIVNQRTRRPTLKLDHYVELLRNAFSDDPTLGCSINPRPENLAKAKQYLSEADQKSISVGRTEQWLAGLRNHVGRQDVEVFGTDQHTQLAKTLVEADYHMKLIGLGLVPGVAGMNSYLDNLKQNPEQAKSVSMLRWWFTTNYQALHATKDNNAFEIIGPGVKVLSENELIGKLGDRVPTGKSDPLSSQFAMEFTKKFELLSAQYPIYSELRNVFDMALITMLIRSENIHQRIDWDPRFLLELDGYQVARAVAPTEVESVISHRITGGKTILAGVSGGVMLDPQKHVTPDAIKQDSYGILEAEYKGNAKIDLPKSVWWWD